MKIKIQTRMVYGRPLHYPMCVESRKLASMGKGRQQSKHTISPRDLKLIKELGYEVEEVPQFGAANEEQK